MKNNKTHNSHNFSAALHAQSMTPNKEALFKSQGTGLATNHVTTVNGNHRAIVGAKDFWQAMYSIVKS